jgi:hypothetical protein
MYDILVEIVFCPGISHPNLEEEKPDFEITAYLFALKRM